MTLQRTGRTLYLGMAIAAGAVLVLSALAFRRYWPYMGALAPKPPPAVVMAMEDAHLVGLNSGRRIWSMNAQSLEMAQNRSLAKVVGISNGKIYADGKVALTVRAGSATYDLYSKSLALAGGVAIEGKDGQSITGEGATWNPTDSTLRSIGRVQIENKWSKIATDSAVVDVRNRVMSMRNVRMTVDMGEAGRHAEER